MMATLLLACATLFPFAGAPQLAADGACVSPAVLPDCEAKPDTGAEPDTGIALDMDGDGSPAAEDCDGQTDEDVPDLLFDLDARRQAVWGLGANIWPDTDAWVGEATS